MTYSVSPFFLDAIYSFGSKVTGEDDPYYTFCKINSPYSKSKADGECYGKLPRLLNIVLGTHSFQRSATFSVHMRDMGGQI